MLIKKNNYAWENIQKDGRENGWVEFDSWSKTYNWNWLTPKGGHTAGFYETKEEAEEMKGL